MLFLGCLSCRPTSGGLYIHHSEHPHICTDISVDAELAKGGGWIYPEGQDWIYPEGEGFQARRVDHDKSQSHE